VIKKTITYKQSQCFASLVRVFTIATFILVAAGTSAQVTSSVDTTQIRIGEELKYSVWVEADTTDIVVFPEGQTFLPLEVIESYKIDTTYDQARYRLIKKYGLTQFDSGSYPIPVQKIFIKERVVLTDSFQIEVRDVPVDTTKQKMFDIKPPIEVESPPFNFTNLLLWLLPVFIIAVLVYVFFRRKKKREEAERQLPPYEEAMVALKNLDDSTLLKEQRSKEFYSQLTEIVKRYLDREVDDAALESTSDELIGRLQLHKDAGHFDFDSETIRKLDAVLKRADLVKFAKMNQAEGQAMADRGVIEEIINETKEVIPEPTEEELLRNEEYLEQQKRKRRNRRVIIGIAIGFLALVITAGVLISTYGLSYLKDNIIGHPTKELSEGRWIRSEYGIPAVIIETPRVLVRTQLPMPEEAETAFRSNETFAYGSMIGNLYVMVNTVVLNGDSAVDPDRALDGGLNNLESQGASNLVVKKESFATEKGIEGLRAHGTFTVGSSGQENGRKQQYEYIIFGQKNALQQVVITYSEDDRYAEAVVQRIINSIEIEVAEENAQ
jgi:cbb3-type cytochrome oxidase subunit 3